MLCQDEFEIPIWVCGSPRWISGIRATTTCTDIIQALVDDEVSAKKSSGKILKKGCVYRF